MKKLNLIFKTLSVILIISILFSAIPYSVGANSVTQLRDSYSKLEKKQDELQKEIDEIAKDIKSQKKYQKALSNQMEVLHQKIEVKNKEIDLINVQIDKKIAEIDAKQKEHDDTLELFGQRLRTMYMSGSESMLEVLLSSESFSQFITRMDMIERIAKHDNDMLDLLKQQHEILEQAKLELDKEKAALEQSKKELDESVTALNINYRKSDEYQDNLNKLREGIELKQEELDAEMEKLDNEIKAAIEKARLEAIRQAKIRAAEEAKKAAEQENTGENSTPSPPVWDVYVGGEFAWPVPGFSTISSYYGEPRGRMFHLGIDIAGGGRSIRGSNIVAANDGLVIYRTYNGTYGNYLIVDHGGGRTTLYAHCDSIYVNVGQTVTRGQNIAAVGNTGFSTGPHLHFEIRINGNTVNPLNYFTRRG